MNDGKAAAPMRPTVRVGIRYISHTVGDQAVWYRNLPDIDSRIEELGIPDEEEIWEWGYCRRSSASYDEQMVEGFADLRAYIEREGIRLDAVEVCRPVYDTDERFFATLTAGLLPQVTTSQSQCYEVEGSECVNVLHAVARGADRIRHGAEHVLVVAAEKAGEERGRFRKYSMVSDFCLAVLLSGRLEHCQWEIIDVNMCAGDGTAVDTSQVLVRDLDRICVSTMLARNGVRSSQVSQLFYLNLFKPIAEMKAKQMGFSKDQIYTEATREIGHCYGADPLIGLHRCLERSTTDRPSVLCASDRHSVAASLVTRLRASA